MTPEQPPAPPPPRAGALARGWRSFRLWRHGRPFWGGLLTMLAGVEILLSGGVDLASIQVRVGLPGFQYYAIPAVLILCGVLTWVTPAQRIFYGVLAALVAVYALVGVNFGGFFLGTLLGLVGGSLTAAWVPVTPVAPAPRTGEEPPASEPATMDELLTGPLTDVLPAATTAPIARQRPLAEAGPLRPEDLRTVDETDRDPGDVPPSRRSPPLLTITMVPVSLAAAALATLPAQRAAHAEPCPTVNRPTAAATRPPATNPSPSPPTSPTSPSPPTSPPPPSPPPSATAAASSGTSTDEDGNLIEEFFDGVGDLIGGLLGGDEQQTVAAAEPTAQPSAVAPSVAPGPTGSSQSAPTRPAPSPISCPAPSGSASPAPPKMLAVPDGQLPVSKRPGLLTGSRVSMSGLSFDGVVDLPTVDGTIRVLQFSMASSTTDDFQLATTDSSGERIVLTSSALTVEGHVRFYSSRFTGKVFGLVELTFTPESPPPLTLPEMFFTDPEIQLVLVDCDRLLAPALRLATP